MKEWEEKFSRLQNRYCLKEDSTMLTFPINGVRKALIRDATKDLPVSSNLISKQPQPENSVPTNDNDDSSEVQVEGTAKPPKPTVVSCRAFRSLYPGTFLKSLISGWGGKWPFGCEYPAFKILVSPAINHSLVGF